MSNLRHNSWKVKRCCQWIKHCKLNFFHLHCVVLIWKPLLINLKVSEVWMDQNTAVTAHVSGKRIGLVNPSSCFNRPLVLLYLKLFCQLLNHDKWCTILSNPQWLQQLLLSPNGRWALTHFCSNFPCSFSLCVCWIREPPPSVMLCSVCWVDSSPVDALHWSAAERTYPGSGALPWPPALRRLPPRAVTRHPAGPGGSAGLSGGPWLWPPPEDEKEGGD